jgi:hypothetical protein
VCVCVCVSELIHWSSEWVSEWVVLYRKQITLYLLLYFAFFNLFSFPPPSILSTLIHFLYLSSRLVLLCFCHCRGGNYLTIASTLPTHKSPFKPLFLNPNQLRSTQTQPWGRVVGGGGGGGRRRRRRGGGRGRWDEEEIIGGDDDDDDEEEEEVVVES